MGRLPQNFGQREAADAREHLVSDPKATLIHSDGIIVSWRGKRRVHAFLMSDVPVAGREGAFQYE